MTGTLNQVALVWWGWMANMFWQAGLLVFLIAVVDLLVRRWAWPQVRYALWLLVLVKLVIPPSWSLPSGIVPKVAPEAGDRIVASVTAVFTAEHRGVRGTGSGLEPARGGGDETPAARADGGASAAAGTTPIAWQVFAMGVWVAGMAAVLFLLLARIRKLRRWHSEQERRRTIPPWFYELLVRTAGRLKLDRLPAIVFTDEIVTPAVYGLFRPVLLLPADYTDTLSREEAKHVLLHELAHLKRGDLVVHGLGMVLHVVYWFNPFLVYAGRQIKQVREMCCDLTIADVLREKTSRYRRTLINTARELLTESVEPGMGLLGVFEEPYRLVARLRWLEKETWRNRSMIIAAVVGVIVLMVPFVLPMAAYDTGAGPSPGAVPGPAADNERERPGRAAGRDLCITEVTRTNSQIDFVGEMWLGDGVAALHERHLTIVCRPEERYLCFINHRDSTYVETVIPLERSDVLESRIRWQFADDEFTGSVRRIEGARRYLDLECTPYEVRFWKERGGDRKDENAFEVWATTDVDFDLSAYHELLRNRRKLQPRDERFRSELEKIEGLQMYIVWETRDGFTRRRRSESEVVEIAERYPEEHAYTMPPGYREKRKLGRGDL